MQKPSPKLVKLFVSLLVVTVTGLFAFNLNPYIFKTKAKKNLQKPDIATINSFISTSINADVMNSLTWKSLGEMIQTIGTNHDRSLEIIKLTSDEKNPAAIYLRGFVLMITNKPIDALMTFNQLGVKEIPGNYLYPIYRLHQQIRPAEVNKYLEAIKQAIDSGSISPLIAARIQAQEGDFFLSISSYLKTDPAQWVSYDVECIKKIGMHSGFSSEMRRMVAGALKSGRVSPKIMVRLRQVLAMKKNPEEVSAYMRKLKMELIVDSDTGKIAVSAIKKLLETRTLFLKNNYQKILDQHKKANSMALSDESVLFLFLSSVIIGDSFEMDRWGQEIKRRYPNKEVIDWISELTTSVK